MTAATPLNAWVVLTPQQLIGTKIISGVSVVAALISLIYILKDYSKDAAIYYKGFMFLTSIIFLLSGMVNLVNMTNGQTQLIAGLISFNGFLAYALLFLITFANGLGEKNSKNHCQHHPHLLNCNLCS